MESRQQNFPIESLKSATALIIQMTWLEARHTLEAALRLLRNTAAASSHNKQQLPPRRRRGGTSDSVQLLRQQLESASKYALLSAIHLCRCECLNSPALRWMFQLDNSSSSSSSTCSAPVSIFSSSSNLNSSDKDRTALLSFLIAYFQRKHLAVNVMCSSDQDVEEDQQRRIQNEELLNAALRILPGCYCLEEVDAAPFTRTLYPELLSNIIEEYSNVVAENGGRRSDDDSENKRKDVALCRHEWSRGVLPNLAMSMALQQYAGMLSTQRQLREVFASWKKRRRWGGVAQVQLRQQEQQRDSVDLPSPPYPSDSGAAMTTATAAHALNEVLNNIQKDISSHVIRVSGTAVSCDETSPARRSSSSSSSDGSTACPRDDAPQPLHPPAPPLPLVTQTELTSPSPSLILNPLCDGVGGGVVEHAPSPRIVILARRILRAWRSVACDHYHREESRRRICFVGASIEAMRRRRIKRVMQRAQDKKVVRMAFELWRDVYVVQEKSLRCFSAWRRRNKLSTIFDRWQQKFYAADERRKAIEADVKLSLYLEVRGAERSRDLILQWSLRTREQMFSRRVRAARYFSQWRTWTVYSMICGDRNITADQMRDRLHKKHVLMVWRRVYAASHAEACYRRGVLHKWHQAFQNAARMRLAEEVVHRRQCFALLRDCIKKWHHAADVLAPLAAEAQHRAMHMQTRFLLRRWRRRTDIASHDRFHLLQWKERCDCTLARYILITWGRCARLRRSETQLKVNCRSLRLQVAFRRWHQRLWLINCIRDDCYARADDAYVRSLRRRVYSQWISAFIDRLERREQFCLRNLENSADALRREALLRKCFHLWQGAFIASGSSLVEKTFNHSNDHIRSTCHVDSRARGVVVATQNRRGNVADRDRSLSFTRNAAVVPFKTDSVTLPHTWQQQQPFQPLSTSATSVLQQSSSLTAARTRLASTLVDATSTTTSTAALNRSWNRPTYPFSSQGRSDDMPHGSLLHSQDDDDGRGDSQFMYEEEEEEAADGSSVVIVVEDSDNDEERY